MSKLFWNSVLTLSLTLNLVFLVLLAIGLNELQQEENSLYLEYECVDYCYDLEESYDYEFTDDVCVCYDEEYNIINIENYNEIKP